ncbi:hypothetical protein [Pseudomonas atagonensis]|uniref:hypothetical protein n=1 Tax=Pseudomonas atagonensis TaxID=2609964 RepID=UPI001FE83C19|nr:hypothetical protein [Pseudomonas atagonensis]
MNSHVGCDQRASAVISPASPVSVSPNTSSSRRQKASGLNVVPARGNQCTTHWGGACNRHSVSNALLPLPAGAQINLTRATEASNGSLNRGRN